MTSPYETERTPIFVDCDPGIDDALALWTLLAIPGVRLLGVSTVGGNVPLLQTSMNARRILAMAERRDVPSAGGMARPLKRHLVPAPEVHGEDGLGNLGLPEPDLPQAPMNGVDLMVSEIMKTKKAVLLATGPLTNVATALRRKEDLHRRLKRIVWMGGSFGSGNITPAAEYNAWVDPDAARIVMQSGVPLTMIGLNVTHQVTIDRATVEEYRKIGNPVSDVTARMLDFYQAFHEETQGTDRSPIHDAVAAVEAAYPGVVQTERYAVDIETKGELTLGQTVVDTRASSTAEPNVDIGIAPDAAFVLETIFSSLSSYGRRPPIA